MISRQDYLAGKCTHREWYGQVVTYVCVAKEAAR